MSWKRAGIGASVALAAIAIGGWFALRSAPVEDWLFHRYAEHMIGRPPGPVAEKNELSVLLCGTASPIQPMDRAGPCTMINAGGHLYIVDVGLASVRNLNVWRVPLEKVDGVLITHFHSDHIAELGELRLETWVAGRKTPLKVYGPPGIEQVVAGFNQAYALDAQYRTEHHGAKFLPIDAAPLVPVVVTMNAGGTAPVFDENGLKVTAIKVHHDPVKPAYGYRFDFGGRSVVVSGDTAFYPPLAAASKGADVLVHEAQNNDMVAAMATILKARGRPRLAKILGDIPSYHATPVQAAKIANMAGAKLLVLTHLTPPPNNGMAERVFLQGVAAVRPEGVMLGHDGLLVRLPVNSKEIDTQTID